MPQKNTTKIYVENGYYHAYNRGVEKRKIFLDKQDYTVFLYYLKSYLSPPKKPPTFMTGLDPVRIRPIKTVFNQIDLLAYCLMPNHFHLLLRQKTRDGMTKLLRRLCTCYSMYFNKKYHRIGGLFQGVYKAILVDNEHYLLHLSRYLHLNPVFDRVRPCQEYKACKQPGDYPFSSYLDYLGKKKTDWLKTDFILSFFKTAQKTSFKDILSYQSFVEDYLVDSTEVLGGLVLEK